MSTPNRAEIRTARQHRLAEIIQDGFLRGKTKLPLIEILPLFSGIATFARASSLHAFVNFQYVNAPNPGWGGHRQRSITLDSNARTFANRILGIDEIFDQPDFTPVGDPIFSNDSTANDWTNDKNIICKNCGKALRFGEIQSHYPGDGEDNTFHCPHCHQSDFAPKDQEHSQVAA